LALSAGVSHAEIVLPSETTLNPLTELLASYYSIAISFSLFASSSVL
jgi:hypothetical protein